MLLSPNDIVIGDRLRQINKATIEDLTNSIASIGLKVPVSVRRDGKAWLLVAGHHRLIACKRLGLAEIEAVEVKGSDIDARLWEIAENLHRADLSAMDRAEHISEWIRLTEEKVSFQVETKPNGGRPESGVNAASRELGVERNEAHRAVKIAALAPEAKAEAHSLGLADNQSALLKAARAPSKEEQLRALREHAAQKAAGRTDKTASEQRVESAVNSVKRLSHEELLVFAEWFDTYREGGGATVFDHTGVGLRA